MINIHASFSFGSVNDGKSLSCGDYRFSSFLSIAYLARLRCGWVVNLKYSFLFHLIIIQLVFIAILATNKEKGS